MSSDKLVWVGVSIAMIGGFAILGVLLFAIGKSLEYVLKDNPKNKEDDLKILKIIILLFILVPLLMWAFYPFDLPLLWQ